MDRSIPAVAVAATMLVLAACGGPVTQPSQRDVRFERIPAGAASPVPDYQVTADSSASWAITAAMGEQRTGGYSIRIDRLTLGGTVLTVTVSTTAPAPGAVTIQVITYPSDTVRVKREDLPRGDLSVVFVDSQGARLAEQRIKN